MSNELDSDKEIVKKYLMESVEDYLNSKKIKSLSSVNNEKILDKFYQKISNIEGEISMDKNSLTEFAENEVAKINMQEILNAHLAQNLVHIETARTSRQEISNSLIPVKGISKKILEQLGKNKIFDAVSLLAKCKTASQRETLAKKLDVNVKHIEMWVKQVDLWRVDGMTTDLAFFFAQAGVRSYLELSHIDIDKVFPILQNLQNAQPDFVLPSKKDVAKIIESAGKMTPPVDVSSLKDLLDSKDKLDVIALAEKIRLSIDCNPYGFEPKPEHLYKEKQEEKQEEVTGENFEPCWIDLDFTLPLPKKVSSFVYLKTKNGNVPYDGVRVELDGVVSPAEDKVESFENPFCVTGVDGHFIITLPDRYCFKETVKIIISTENGKQYFVKNSSEIIDAVAECKFVNCLQDIVNVRSACRTEYLESVSKSESLSSTKDISLVIKDLFDARKAEIKEKYPDDIDVIAELWRKFDSAKDENDFNKIALNLFNECLKKSSLEAEIEGVDTSSGCDGFVVDEENCIRKDACRDGLPKVKLMGDDDNPVLLSTDQAPSKVFSYSMLQRLVEPKLASNNGKVLKIRETLNRPVDVAGFKECLYKDTQSFPQMSSLGLGYRLNMHQAWIPDGFALGELLYSLILAPGEEQRVIVREKKQTYTLTDTAEGVDNVSEQYDLSQVDDTTAAYNYAMNQMMDANSSYRTRSEAWGVGGTTGCEGTFTWGKSDAGKSFSLHPMTGISGSYAKTSSSGSSNAHQSNSQNEVSSAAQTFQHGIKSAANRLSQAKRISVSTASSDVSDSVATKIVANHNHSHALTMQYWEVMRRYRMETAIDSVDLVLFVPMKLIDFIDKRANDKNYSLSMTDDEEKFFDKEKFRNRYFNILKYADTLEVALPYEYRPGLRLIKKYAAIPEWTYEKLNANSHILNLTFKGHFLPFDDLTAMVCLKDGRGCIAGELTYEREPVKTKISSRLELNNWIRQQRCNTSMLRKVVRCYFELPSDVSLEDISSISICYSCEDFSYTLYQDDSTLSEAQKEAWRNLLREERHFAQDDKDSSNDLKRIDHYMERLPEAFVNPRVELSAQTIQSLGSPCIYDVSVTLSDSKSSENVAQTINAVCSSNKLSSVTKISLSSFTATLKRSELQKMEETYRHIVTDTLYYSQMVWSFLSSDELAMILDQYNVNMDFSLLEERLGGNADAKSKDTNIALLNCINVRKPLGFYGNCMLFPFTFPQELALKLGRTAGDIQEQIYRYHTNCFRAPTTIVSFPTNGMIGEAVLGQTNVSEEIDLTRFWNWKDSDIDKMSLDDKYLDGGDYLAGKTTKDITSLGLEGVKAPTAVSVPDLIKALVDKKTPSFNDITGLKELSTVVKAVTDSASSGRNAIITASADLFKKAIEAKSEVKKEELKNGKNDKAEAKGSSSGTGKNDSESKTSANSGEGKTDAASTDSSEGKTDAASTSSGEGTSDVMSSAGSGDDSSSSTSTESDKSAPRTVSLQSESVASDFKKK